LIVQTLFRCFFFQKEQLKYFTKYNVSYFFPRALLNKRNKKKDKKRQRKIKSVPAAVGKASSSSPLHNVERASSKTKKMG
jgi:predicted permease